MTFKNKIRYHERLQTGWKFLTQYTEENSIIMSAANIGLLVYVNCVCHKKSILNLKPAKSKFITAFTN